VGNPTTVSYTLEVATSDTFANKLVGWQFNEQPNETRFTSVSAFPANTQLFWRVRASEGSAIGPWSDTAVFRTPPPVVVTPTPTPGPGPGGSCASATSHLGVVECRRKQYGFMTPDLLNQFLRGVAKDLNAGNFAGGPFGILVKTSGNQCGGYSCDIICSSNSNLWDVLTDSDATQSPAWTPKGTSSSTCEIQR
jgi:hypothetical protein